MSEVDKEKALRDHIRNLLLAYALTHLTKDYIAFTEDTVYNLLSECLREVPTTDPHSLILPEDPFDTVSRTYASLEPYDQKWPPLDSESMQYLRKNIRFHGKPKTERCWMEDDDFNYEKSMYRPMSPELTARALRQTPRPSTKGFLKSLPASLSEFLTSHSFKTLEVEAIEEQPKVKLEDALNLVLHVDAQAYTAVVKLLTSTAALSRLGPGRVNPHIDAFLRGDFPPSTYVRPESPFIPLFPRDRLPGSTANMAGQPHPSGLESISDLPAKIENVKIEDECPDLYKAHMTVVDGWQTYKSSSPSGPSTPASSQGENIDQIDELFLFSSPNTDPAPIQVLMDAKMDEVEMPRTTKIGGARKRPKPLGSGEELASFLLPLIQSLQPVSAPSIEAHPSSPQPSMSMIGEPPSAAGGCDELDPYVSCAMAETYVADSLDGIIAKVCKDVQGQDPKDLILNEKLDEKDGLLMEVPTLLPPNIHPANGIFIPTNLQDLSALSKHQKSVGATRNPKAMHLGFLRKAKGIPSLNMELSWMPFKFGPKAPTHEEVTGVSGIVEEKLDCDGNQDAEQMKYLFRKAAVMDSDGNSGADSFQCRDYWTDSDEMKNPGPTEDDCEMILTRSERRRLSGIPVEDEYLHAQDDEDGSGGESQHGHVSHPSPAEWDSQRPAKRPRLQRNSYHPQDINDSGVSLLPYVNTPDNLLLDLTTPGNPYFDDSNTYFPDVDKENMPPASSFNSDEEYQASFARYTMDQSYEDQGEPVDGDQYCVGLEDPAFSTDETDPDRRGFLPLSFDSHQAPTSQPAHPICSQGDLASQSNNISPIVVEPETVPPQNVSAGPCLDTCSYALPPTGLADFMDLRSKQSTANELRPELSPKDLPAVATNHAAAGSYSPHVVPEELFDRNTIRLPTPWLPPRTIHRYMASMDVIQKRSLVRSFLSPQCAVNFVERGTLNGVDLILDPHSAIIFTSLLALPSQCEALVARLGQQSQHYSRLLVIFETFPRSHTYAPRVSTEVTLYPFSPPILKALKKLRRDLEIAEACEVKRKATDVLFAFAGTVNEAAMFARAFGDLAEGCDETQGAIWDDREWLDTEGQEGEDDMATVSGMNAFAAAVILCQTSLQDFLDWPAEARLNEFGLLIGVPRMKLLNDVIARRLEAMELALSGPSADEDR